MENFPFYKQEETADCGIACLRMIAKYYGKEYTSEHVRLLTDFDNSSLNLANLSNAAFQLGFRTISVHITLQKLKNEVPLPCILHWDLNHFVVLYDIENEIGVPTFVIAEPAMELLWISEIDFKTLWYTKDANKGVALLFETIN